MTHLIIDSDTIAFGCAATAEDDELWVATSRANDFVENLIRLNNATSYELWLTGKGNFRYNVYPEYKANRLEAYRPKWEKSVKDYLVDQWQANWSEGCEADDMVGVSLCSTPGATIAHLDKDINLIPGQHFNWELTRLGKVVREARHYFITEEEALRNFYTQLLTGDVTDNIKGVPGIGPKKAEKLLQYATTEEEMYNVCLDTYGSVEEMEMNARCLWLWRKLNDNVLDRWKQFGEG